jgi:hypothetical protein
VAELYKPLLSAMEYFGWKKFLLAYQSSDDSDWLELKAQLLPYATEVCAFDSAGGMRVTIT